MLSRWQTWLESRVWDDDLDDAPYGRRLTLGAVRLLWLVTQDISNPQFSLRVMSLVYTTLLTLVPFLALGFSLLKAFGVHNLIEPVLANVLHPLGGGAEELTQIIIGFVENVKVGILGGVGLALLIFAAISLIQKVENGFNYIWQVRRSRTLVRRISDYFSVLTIGPLVVAIALGSTASVMSNRFVQHILEIEPFGSLLLFGASFLPYIITCLGFAFLYYFIPNTRVKAIPALVGGLVAGVTWQTASWAFAYYVGNMGNYNAVYSGFAILIFLLIWFYVCWMVLLLGCHVSFLLQHPEFLMRRQLIQHMGGRLREHLALLIMALVGRNFIEDRPPWRAASLVKHTHLPPGHVYHVIDRLIEHGYLVEAGLSQSHLMPERDLASMPLKNLLRDIRSSNAELRLDRREQHPHSQVAGLMQRLQNGQEEVLGNMTVRDLALQNQTDNP